jgi:histidine triad (HIT) family protein
VSNVPCIFCEVLAGRAEATFLHRDAVCAAFMDIQPVNAGHVLIIPVRHAADLGATNPSEWSSVANLGRRVAAALRVSGLRCEGVNLFLADGASAGQEVFHSHLHVIPRFAGDGFGLRFPDGYRNLPSRDALEDAADKIKRRLDLDLDPGGL